MDRCEVGGPLIFGDEPNLTMPERCQIQDGQ